MSSRAPPVQLELDLAEPDPDDDGSFDYFVRSNRPPDPDPPADTREDEP